MKDRARLAWVEHDRKITKETDGQLLFEYQRAILLTLKEDGTLDEAQYRYTEEKLKKQLQIYIIKESGAGKGGRSYDKSSGLLPGVHRSGGSGQFF